jgi:parvulin-like peptidyl-prolyl isomerase
MRLRPSSLALALLLTLNTSPAFAVVAAGGMNNSDDNSKGDHRPAGAAPAPAPGAPAAADEAAPPPPPARTVAPPPPAIKPVVPAGPAVATVDGVAIPKAEYDRVFAMLKRRYQARYGIDFTSERGKAVEADIKNGLIDHLVEKQYVLNEGNRRGITASPTEVDAKLDELKKQAGSEDEFNSTLNGTGMTVADLKREIADGLIVHAVADALTAGITVSDDDAKAYYAAHGTDFDKPEEVRVRHILVKDKATAEKLLAQLKGGADFAELAKANSEDPGSKGDGGDLGFFSKGRMVPEFEEAAFKLKPGELSGVVQTQFGFHILQGVDYHPAHHLTFDEAKPQIVDTLSEGRKESTLSTWLEQQKKQVKVTYAPGYAPGAAAKPAPKPAPKASPKAKPQAKPKANHK